MGVAPVCGRRPFSLRAETNFWDDFLMMMTRISRYLATAGMACLLPMIASAAAPVIQSIDPPEWWANMPAAMLLIRGENLQGASVRMSDPSLQVTSVTISANGHWAAVHLDASPASPENVTVSVMNLQGKTSASYMFRQRRAVNDGMAGFSSKDVMYLIMTDRFANGDPSNDGPLHADEKARPRGWHGGDLRGVTQHLDYLQSLGITTVWITPVYQNHNSDSYHGYGATDLYKVDEHFGTLEDMKQLAGQLHRRGMKLVLDTVPNHIGPNHPWVEDEPEPDWFHGTLKNHDTAIGDFKPLVDPHAAWRDQKDILEGWFANTLPDMNQENSDVAQYLTQNAIWWIEETGADGLRIDTFPYVGRPFWHSFHAQLHALYPNLTSVGEIFNGDAVITSAFAGGVTRGDLNGDVDTGLSTPFDFPTYFAIRNVILRGHSMTEMADILRQDSLYPHPERLVAFLGNHDTTRFMGEPEATPAKLQLAFAMLLTMRGMPQIYSGDEIAMRGAGDPDNRHEFPGGFAGADHNAFIASQRRPEEQQTFDTVQNLLKLRATYEELNLGQEQILHADDNTLVYARGEALSAGCNGSAGRVLVAINKSAGPLSIVIDTSQTSLAGCGAASGIFGSATLSDATVAKSSRTLLVPPGASLLYLK